MAQAHHSTGGTKLRLPFKTDSIASRISSTPLFRYASHFHPLPALITPPYNLPHYVSSHPTNRYQSTAPSKPPTPTTTFLPASSSTQTLASQRLLRPTSPNLGIYALSINYVTSPLNRITGSLLAGSFYIFGFTYLVAPYLGFHVDVNGIAEAFGGLDGWVKGVVKFGVAWPFVFQYVLFRRSPLNSGI